VKRLLKINLEAVIVLGGVIDFWLLVLHALGVHVPH
jgi:hypothetical protein